MSAKNIVSALTLIALVGGVLLYLNRPGKAFKPNTTVPSNGPDPEAFAPTSDFSTVSRQSFNKVWGRRHSAKNFVEIHGGQGICTETQSLGLKDGETGYQIDNHGRRFLHVCRGNEVLTYHDRYSAGNKSEVLYILPRHEIEGCTDLTTAREVLNSLAAAE